MHKALVIARREYAAAVKTKSFLISIIILPILMGGGALVQLLLKDQVDTTEKRFAVIDRTPGGQLVQTLQEAAKRRSAEEIRDPATGEFTRPPFEIESVAPSDDDPESVLKQHFELSERVRSGELFGFLDIGATVLDTPLPTATSDSDNSGSEHSQVRYQSNSPTYDDFRNWASPVLQKAVQEARFKRAQLDSETVRSAMQPVSVVVKGLSEIDRQTGAIAEAKDENPIVSILAPAAMMILMFMLILVSGTPAMQGVVEEKMQRIAEMVLGSVRPFELMIGKLMGLIGVSLTLSALYLGAAYWAAEHYGVADVVSPGLIAWFLVFLVVALIMYGSLFIAVGAACSDIRDTQTMLWPVMLVSMLPLFVWINVAKEPTSAFSTAVSFFPFATPMLMLLRVAVPPGIGWLQPTLGLLVMLATTMLCVYVAGRIFRVGLLMQGKGASLRDLARWIVRG